jgi:hypothetical protein
VLSNKRTVHEVIVADFLFWNIKKSFHEQPCILHSINATLNSFVARLCERFFFGTSPFDGSSFVVLRTLNCLAAYHKRIRKKTNQTLTVFCRGHAVAIAREIFNGE